jgi:hypothetical protein
VHKGHRAMQIAIDSEWVDAADGGVNEMFAA